MSSIQTISAFIFGIALFHTFSTKFFERMAHLRPDHAGIWHLLGEVEVVFGFWAMVLVIAIAVTDGRHAATEYVDSRNFGEPMFVFAIMVVAGSRAVLRAVIVLVRLLSRCMPLPGPMAFYFLALSIVPLFGSLITEPAAMTLAALMLGDRAFNVGPLTRNLRYATLGVLFVNVSIGGTLTSFAAPPVLMVASKWNWDVHYMLTHFGWRSTIAVFFNATAVTFLFRRELARLPEARPRNTSPMPVGVTVLHLGFLVGIVAFAHHPPIFMGILLFFLGFATAYPQYQDRLILREGLMVAFFLSGLVVLGGQQQWWLDELLHRMDATTVYFGATALTAITDNAALTYLGSLAENLSEPFKIALVSGAVTGGGLTVIANAPNPAGFAILRGYFEDEAVHPAGLFIAALPATLVAIFCFRVL